jgi:hypothetical protein
LCSEFFDYQALESGSVPIYEIGDRVDAFWVAIQTLKDPATGKQLYLIKFVQARHKYNLRITSCNLIKIDVRHFQDTISMTCFNS